MSAELSTLLARVLYLRAPYGSYPWTAWIDGQQLSGLPQMVDHPQLGRTVAMGARCWRTRREAVAAVTAMVWATVDTPQ